MAKPGPKPKPKHTSIPGQHPRSSSSTSSPSWFNARRPVIVNFPTSDRVQDANVNQGEEGEELLSLKESLTTIQSIRQSRHFYLHHLFPLFVSPPPPPVPASSSATAVRGEPSGSRTGGAGEQATRGNAGRVGGPPGTAKRSPLELESKLDPIVKGSILGGKGVDAGADVDAVGHDDASGKTTSPCGPSSSMTGGNHPASETARGSGLQGGTSTGITSTITHPSSTPQRPVPPPTPAQPPSNLSLPLPPHKIKLIQSNCTFRIGPIELSGVGVWECRWDEVSTSTSTSMQMHTPTPTPTQTRMTPLVDAGVGVPVDGRARGEMGVLMGNKVVVGPTGMSGSDDQTQARATGPSTSPNGSGGGLNTARSTTPNLPIPNTMPTSQPNPIPITSAPDPTTGTSSSSLAAGIPPRPLGSSPAGGTSLSVQVQGRAGDGVGSGGSSSSVVVERVVEGDGAASLPAPALAPAPPPEAGAGGNAGPRGLTPGPPITHKLVELINLKALSHPWLSSLIYRAARGLASASELKRLGGAVEILNGGWDLPGDMGLAERAAGDVIGYLRSGPRRLVVNGVLLGVGGLPIKPQPSARAPGRSSTNVKKKTSSTGAPRTPTVAPPATPVGPTAPIPEYPLILISFAENPALKFVLPVPLAYMSFAPTQIPGIDPTMRPTPGTAQRTGRVLCSTFLPSRGWGRWEPENATSTDQARKRRRKDYSAHTRLGLPKEDKEFIIGGCVVPPGPVEPLTIKFEGVLDSTWTALSRLAKEVEECLEERRRKQEIERVKARKIALEKAERAEAEKKQGEKEKKDVEMVTPAPESFIMTEEGSMPMPLSNESTLDDMIVFQPKEATRDPSPKRPKRESKKKRWSDGEEETVKSSASSRQKSNSLAKPIELDEEMAVDGDDPSKSFKLKRVPSKRYLKFRLAAPLPEDLVKASTHISDPVIKDLTLSKAAAAAQSMITVQRKRPRASVSTQSVTKRTTGPRSKKVKIGPAVVVDQVVSDLPASNAISPTVELEMTEKIAAGVNV